MSRQRRTRATAVESEAVTLRLPYRPPLDWSWLLGFLATRAIPGVEVVHAGEYVRSLRVGSHAGGIVVRHAPRAHALDVVLTPSLAPARRQVRAALVRMFDLDADPRAIAAHFAGDDIMGPLVQRRPGLRLPGAADVFELAVRGVIGQQISVAAARTIAGRIHAAFGDRVRHPGGITHLAATAEQLAAADPAAIARLGMPLSRARTLVLLGAGVASGEIDLRPESGVEDAVSALLRVPGIGPWTAEYIAMRGYQQRDAFPATDLGIRNALRGVDVAARAEAWRPWRAYAAIHLWASLGDRV